MRHSVFVKIGAVFLGFYITVSMSFFSYSCFESYLKMIDNDHRVLSRYLATGRILIRGGELQELVARLDEAVEAREIHYYSLREGSTDIAYSNRAGVSDPIRMPAQAGEGAYEAQDRLMMVIEEGEMKLIVGQKIGFKNYFYRVFQANIEMILKDIAIVGLLVVSLVFYSFRDLRELLSRMQKRGLKRGDTSIARSSEVLTLVKGLKGFEENKDALEQENAMLKGQVLPALQKELHSGKKPPYEFNCTMVRADINNFTTLFTTQDRAKFSRVVNDFFVGVTHIVSRYNGYVYEFVGDEVIFYFKDEDHSNSAAIALSALRDVVSLAEQVNERTGDEFGYSFRIKSSLAWGTLRFGPLVNGFSLAGAPLIETVRLLSHVNEKSANTILFEETLGQRVSFLCVSKEMGVVLLKGLANSRRLRVYEAHVPLIHHLRQGTDESIEMATFYRSDRDICEALDFVRANFDTLSQQNVLHLLSVLRGFRVTEVSVDIKKSYLDLIEDLQSRAAHDPSDEKTGFALASIVSDAVALFPEGALTGRLREVLLICLRSKNSRVVANTVDVFSALDPLADDQVFEALSGGDDNRVNANLLIKQGVRDWDSKTRKRLTTMLKTPSVYAKASALYALGEIARSLKAQDEVAFNSNRRLQELLEEGYFLLGHANKMVRRQAVSMAQKSGIKPEELQARDFWSQINSDVRDEVERALTVGDEVTEASPKRLRAV